MKRFDYQVLRFAPDSETEEFVNVGVVVFGSDGREAGSRFSAGLDRVRGFFPRTDIETLRRQLEIFSERLEHIQSQDEAVSAFRLTDASPFVLTPLRRALDFDLDSVLDDLADRMLHYHEGTNLSGDPGKSVGSAEQTAARRVFSDKVIRRFLQGGECGVHDHGRRVRPANVCGQTGGAGGEFELLA